MMRLPARPAVSDARSSGPACGTAWYAVTHPTVLWPTVMVGTFGFFTISLPVTLAAFAKNEFHSGAIGAGVLNGAAAAGALGGALLTARRRNALRLRTIAMAAALLAAAQVVASFGSSQVALTVLIVLVGAANLAFLTSAQSLCSRPSPSTSRARRGDLPARVHGQRSDRRSGRGLHRRGARGAVGLLLAGLVPALVTALVAGTSRTGRRCGSV